MLGHVENEEKVRNQALSEMVLQPSNNICIITGWVSVCLCNTSHS